MLSTIVALYHGENIALDNINSLTALLQKHASPDDIASEFASRIEGYPPFIQCRFVHVLCNLHLTSHEQIKPVLVRMMESVEYMPLYTLLIGVIIGYIMDGDQSLNGLVKHKRSLNQQFNELALACWIYFNLYRYKSAEVLYDYTN